MWTLTRDLLIALAGILIFIGVADANDDQWIHDTNLGKCYTQQQVAEREQEVYGMGFRTGQADTVQKLTNNIKKMCESGQVVDLGDGNLLLCVPKEAVYGSDNSDK